VIVDIRMPGKDGYDVCRELKSRPATRLLPVMLVTAYREMKDRTLGALAGADDFLTLPLNRLELTARVKSLLRLPAYFKGIEEHQNVILALASALEAKDPATRGHSERVGHLSARLAFELGLPEEACDRIRTAGLLHDIGEIGVPERVLKKPGVLSEDELHAVRMHASDGEAICRPLGSLHAILPIIRHHHERLDGTGYPDHLRGDAIPLGARIVGLAGAYDALTSERSYRPALPSLHALSILEKETLSGLWDPNVYACLARLVRRGPAGAARRTGDGVPIAR